jgi:hypothetical protein
MKNTAKAARQMIAVATAAVAEYDAIAMATIDTPCTQQYELRKQAVSKLTDTLVSAGFLKSGNFRSETYFADKAGEVTVLRGGMGFSVVYAAPEFLAKRAATRERFAAFDASREREERA